MSPASRMAGGPIKSYEKNLFLTFWHQMDHWYRDIGLFRGERKRRGREWLSAWSGGSLVIPGVKHKYATGLHIHHQNDWYILIFLSQTYFISLLTLIQKYNYTRLLFASQLYLPLIGPVMSWWPLIGWGEERVVIDRDQFLRTRSVVTRPGRHQTASPASDMWDPASRDQGLPALLRCPRSPHCPGHCAPHVITGAAWQAGAQELLSQNESKYDQWMEDTVPSHIFLLP